MFGSVSAQTALVIEKGQGDNIDFSYADGSNHYANATVQFKNSVVRWSFFGGTDYHVSWTTGETHTFKVTLGTGDNEVSQLHIAALKSSNSNDWWNGGNTIKDDQLVSSATIDVVDGAELTMNVTADYAAVIIWKSGSSDWQKVKIASITRTITTASSVNAPTISPDSGTYDEDENLIVTITKGEGNDDVVYSVSGATSGNVTDVHFTSAELSAGFKTLTLTGTGTITVTATGYKNSEASTTVTNTYTTDVPSGKTPIASDNRTLPYTFNSADDNIEFNANRFNNQNIVIGNYVVLDIDVTNDNTWFCFKRGWGDDYFNQCNEISSGLTANNCWVNKNDSYWWMKISDQNACNAFTGNNVQIKGSKIKDTNTYSAMTVNSFSIYESKAISELVDNAIASKINNVVVELTRSLVAGTWNTICLPFALTSTQATQLFGSGYKVAAFTGVHNEIMQFTTLNSNDDFEAGVPYLVNPTADLSNSSPIVLVDVNLTAKNGSTVTYDGYSFVGTLVKKTFTENLDYTRFVASGNELKKPVSGTTLKALRAYFILPASFDPDQAPKLSIDGDGEATEIISIDNERVIMDNVYYDLSGRRVMNPTKGLYIVNGRKVIVK